MPPTTKPPYGLAVWAVDALTITTDPRCCAGRHPSVSPAGARGAASAGRQDFRATNVVFRGHPHPILCLRSMVRTRRGHPTRDTVDRWVHDLHTLARRLDDPPHATPTATAPYRRLAQRGPTNRTRRGAADQP